MNRTTNKTPRFISRAEVLALSSDYVAFVEGDFDKWEAIDTQFAKARKGQEAITFHNGNYLKVTISSVNHDDVRAIDGPVVRVSDGEFSWRVDGDKYAFILPDWKAIKSVLKSSGAELNLEEL